MAAHFKIVEVNPNDVTGGSGCLCDDGGCNGTKAPFAAFYGTDMESVVSPTPVVCAGCIRELADQLEDFEAKNSPKV